MIECPKCHYVRQDGDAAPDCECPKCGVIYAKVRGEVPAPTYEPSAPVAEPVIENSHRRAFFMTAMAIVAAAGVAINAWYVHSQRGKVELRVRSITAELLSAFDPSRTVGESLKQAGEAYSSLETKRKAWYAEGAVGSEADEDFRVRYGTAAQEVLQSYQASIGAQIQLTAARTMQSVTHDYDATAEANKQDDDARKKFAQKIAALAGLVRIRPAYMNENSVVREALLRDVAAWRNVILQ